MIEIGVDVGGTFTDVVCLKDENRIFATKVSSTPQNPAQGVVTGVDRILKMANCKAEQVERIIHGTTVATNTILQKKGAKVGLLVTKGFEDIVETGTQRRHTMYDYSMDPEAPTYLCPRYLRAGIVERMDATGAIVEPLNEEEVRSAVTELVSSFHIEALAICYLFSFINPVHEIRTKEIVQQMYPRLWISMSSALNPVFREYRRVLVTLSDAYIRGSVLAYLGELEKSLNDMGIQVGLQVIQSHGGIMGAKSVSEKAVALLFSGPAAGVIGAVFAGEQSKVQNLISIDLGGTSCDVALVAGGRALTTTEAEFAGYPLRVPMIDLTTIGAGGGSIAWIAPGGGLRVGPISAGAEPGPACYNRGGTLPTVTDASLVLGYLNPSYFAGGELTLSVELAEKAVASIAEPLDLDIVEAAYGIHKVINENMMNQIRFVSLKRGHDPRNFHLVLLGGASSIHGGILARELSIPYTIIPPSPGTLSAFGLLVANIEHVYSKTFWKNAKEAKVEEANSFFSELDQLGIKAMEADEVAQHQVNIRRVGEMRYVGQGWELDVPLAKEMGSIELSKASEDFHNIYKAIYGFSTPEIEVEFVNLRAEYSFSLPRPHLTYKGGYSLSEAKKGTRRAYFRELGGYVEVPLYERHRIPRGETLTGPLIIEQPDTTSVIYPGQTCHVDEAHNIIVKVKEG